MATNPENPTPAAATPEPARKTTGATPETKQKAARTTARKPRARKSASARKTTSTRTTAAARKTTARSTPGATAARPSLGRPTRRPTARPVVVEPVVEPVAEAVAEPVAAAAAASPFSGSLLDAVEAAGTRVADYHQQIAEATPLPWVANVARANAELTRFVTRAYVTGGRSLLRS